MDKQQTRTKARAKRINPFYIVRRSAWRSARFWTSVAISIAVLAWIGISSVSFNRSKNKWSLTALAHNPGHVTIHHAQLEQNCAACHVTDAKGGFVTHVRDDACIECHDASIHHVNQTSLIARFEPKPSTQPAAEGVEAAAPTLPMDHHPQGMRSSDCVHCHVEHRGEQALMGRDPSVCLECHANLVAHDSQKPLVQNSVTAFNAAGGHPRFGLHPDPMSVLQNNGGRLTDRTRIRFNHLLHNQQPGLTDNCVACHTPTNPSNSASLDGKAGTPKLLAKDQPLSAQAETAAGNMQPISFERNCVQCHTLDLDFEKNGKVRVAVSHSELAIVRSQLGALGTLALQQQKLDPDASWDDRNTAASDAMSAISTKIADMVSAARASTQPAAASPPADLDGRKIAAVNAYVLWLLGESVGVPEGTIKQLSGKASLDVPDPNLTEVYLTTVGAGKQIGSACIVCHDLNHGDVPAGVIVKGAGGGDKMDTVADESLDHLGLPLRGPSTQPAFLATVPTGIPAAPHHWFAKSHFDHSAHRDLSCFNCHANAWTSTDTADVLSPDIDSANLLTATERQSHHIQSCVDCHSKTESLTARTAPDDCTTCHVYHDRTKQDADDARLRQQHRSVVQPVKLSADASR